MTLSIRVLLLLLPFGLAAGEPADRLQQLLKQHPAADANQDGTLTADEARAYAQKTGLEPKSRVRKSNAASDGRPNPRRPAPTFADVSYGPHERNKLDLWLAKSATATPLVVFIHGGGFVNGSKAAANAELIKRCLDAGVSFMAINYRYRSSAPIQDILRDCARSIQYVRTHAKQYNVDPARIASYGGSAGAGTSLWLAFHPDLADPANPDPVLRHSSRIVAAGALNTQATYNLRRWPEFVTAASYERPGEMAAFYGAKTAAELDEPKYQAVLADTDMLALITPDDPPVFMYTGHPDGDVSDRGHLLHHPNHARAVKKACDAAGVSATVLFGSAEPRFEGDHVAALGDFLLRQLKATRERE